jgi:PIN domain nuclease of toxin-antitoxin system
VKLLLDTHILLWAAGGRGASTDKMPAEAERLIVDPANTLVFSAASIWEVAIKSGLGREDFHADPHRLRRGLLDNGYEELAISSAHAAAVSQLPPIHRDPFDRLLIAQATAEGLTLLTSDDAVARYPGPIQKV